MPRFNDSLYKVWFNYAEKQKLIFLSDSSTYDTLTVSNIYFSESFKTTISGNNSGCYSSASVAFTHSDTSSAYAMASIGYRIMKDQYSSGNQNSLLFGFPKRTITRGALSDTGTQQEPYVYNSIFSSRFFSSATLGNKTFSNIQEIVIDTSVKTALVKNEIFKVWIVKDFGLAAYQQYQGKLWVKQ